jgi:hypothetical protein
LGLSTIKRLLLLKKAKEIVNVGLLGSFDTLKAVTSTAIVPGLIIIPVEYGKIKHLLELTADDQTYKMKGIALTSATENDQVIEFISCVPQQHIVKGCLKLTKRIL